MNFIDETNYVLDEDMEKEDLLWIDKFTKTYFSKKKRFSTEFVGTLIKKTKHFRIFLFT